MNPFKKIQEAFLKTFGDIKVFSWPMFILYDPGSYKVKGEDMRQVIECIEPGDILVRGYDNYLDGFFIPGSFSHAGLYLGSVTDDDRRFLAPGVNGSSFKTGRQMVIHSMAEGVFMEDILNFCRCDRMAIVRFPRALKAAARPADSAALFTGDEKNLSDRLARGETVPFADAFPTIFSLALGQLGKGYDFSFNFKSFNNLSCTEFVYFCVKSLQAFHGISPVEKRVLLFKKAMIEPDAFMGSSLPTVWQSRSVKR